MAWGIEERRAWDRERKRRERAALRDDSVRWAAFMERQRQYDAKRREKDGSKVRQRIRDWSREKRRVRGSFAGWFWMSEGRGVAGRLKRLARVCAWAGLGAKRSSQEQLAAGWAAHDAWIESLDAAD